MRKMTARKRHPLIVKSAEAESHLKLRAEALRRLKPALLAQQGADAVGKDGREAFAAFIVEVKSVLEERRRFERIEGVLVEQDDIGARGKLADGGREFVREIGGAGNRTAGQADEDDFGGRP